MRQRVDRPVMRTRTPRTIETVVASLASLNLKIHGAAMNSSPTTGSIIACRRSGIGPECSLMAPRCPTGARHTLMQPSGHRRPWAFDGDRQAVGRAAEAQHL